MSGIVSHVVHINSSYGDEVNPHEEVANSQVCQQVGVGLWGKQIDSELYHYIKH